MILKHIFPSVEVVYQALEVALSHLAYGSIQLTAQLTLTASRLGFGILPVADPCSATSPANPAIIANPKPRRVLRISLCRTQNPAKPSLSGISEHGNRRVDLTIV